MSYVTIVAVILFVVGFATGPGSIPWFFVTELFTQSGRPTATSIAVSVNWAANFLVGLGFEPIRVTRSLRDIFFTNFSLISASAGTLGLHGLHGDPGLLHLLCFPGSA